MRFLLITKPREAMPMEMAVPLIQAMKAWVNKYQSNHQMEQAWSFSGIGGGGIVNVSSNEELEAIMTEFPALPFSSVEILPLADLDKSMDRYLDAFKKMGGGQPAGT